MRRIPYHCNLPVGTVQVLEMLASTEWSGLEVATPSEPRGITAVVADGLRIRTNQNVLIEARSIDLIPKLEVFQPYAVSEPLTGSGHSWSTPRRYQSLGELVAPFVGRGHQLFVGARRYQVPAWASEEVGRLVVEDVVLVKGPGGRLLVIGPDNRRPLALVIGSDWSELPDADTSIEYLRPI